MGRQQNSARTFVDAVEVRVIGGEGVKALLDDEQLPQALRLPYPARGNHLRVEPLVRNLRPGGGGLHHFGGGGYCSNDPKT